MTYFLDSVLYFNDAMDVRSFFEEWVFFENSMLSAIQKTKAVRRTTQ
jgi:hypothetical protein